MLPLCIVRSRRHAGGHRRRRLSSADSTRPGGVRPTGAQRDAGVPEGPAVCAHGRCRRLTPAELRWRDEPCRRVGARQAPGQEEAVMHRASGNSRANEFCSWVGLPEAHTASGCKLRVAHKGRSTASWARAVRCSPCGACVRRLSRSGTRGAVAVFPFPPAAVVSSNRAEREGWHSRLLMDGNLNALVAQASACHQQ